MTDANDKPGILLNEISPLSQLQKVRLRSVTEDNLDKANKVQLVAVTQKLNKLRLLRESYRKHNLIEFFNLSKEDDPDNLPANPMQKALLDAWEDPEKKVFTYTGGNRTGKTTIGVILAISILNGGWPWDKDHRFHFPHSDPRRVRIIGQDWEKHIKTVVIPALEKWWPESMPLERKRNNLGIDAVWEYKTGKHTIEIMSNNQLSELHEGWQGDLIYYDEPPRREVRVANARGLVDREGREIFCMTLLKEAWVDREVIRATNKDGTPDLTVFNVHGTIYQNEGFGITKKGIDQFAKTLTEEEREARLLGKPAYLSGLVAKYFSRDVHLIDRFDIPTTWPVDIAVDIHPRKRQAILFVATSPQQIKYVCFEIWEHGSGEAVGDMIIRTVMRYGLNVNRIICDPLAKSDSNNANTTYDRINRVLFQHGLCMGIASKSKDTGILEINKHLRGPNKTPSMFFFNDLVRTLYEIEGWMYDKKTQVASKHDDDMMENLYRILLLDTTNNHASDMARAQEQMALVPSHTDETAGWY